MSTRHEAEQFVRGLYQGVLRREPDAEGLHHYTACILGGHSHLSVLNVFLDSDEFRGSSNVKLFFPPGHFYSPVANPAEVSEHFALIDQRPIPESLPEIVLDRDLICQTWSNLLPYLTTMPFTEAGRSGFRYQFDNPAYAWADGSILHGMLRHYRPSRVIEIGSGWSSACMLDTVEQYLDPACELTFIEPYTRLLHELLGVPKVNVRILEQPVQRVQRELFMSLQANDILLIDSTHVLRTGSDVCYELFEILPCLASGVIVHIHDMFWPFEYPRSWAIDENRSWNELYAVRALLMNNDHWKIIMFNDWFGKFKHELISNTFPSFLRNPGSALWLQRT